MNEILWTTKAIKQLRRIPEQQRKGIVLKVNSLVLFPAAKLDVKKLKNRNDYRLRIGRYRVIFTHETELKIISVEEVRKRDERTY